MWLKMFASLCGLLVLQACSGGTSPAGTQSPPPPVAKQFVNWSTVQVIAVDSSTRTATQTADAVFYSDTYNGLSLVDDSNLEQVGAPRRLVASEISDGVHGSFDEMLSVALDGNIAAVAVIPGCVGFCAGETRELRLYDISDRTKATYLATLADALGPEVLLAEGNYLYVTGTYGMSHDQFAVVDISDPKAPKKVGAVDIHGAGRLAKVGNLVYLSLVSDTFGWDWQNIRVIDVSNPSAPALIGPADPGVSANITFSPIVVKENIAYVSDEGLRVVDLSDPLAPSLVTTVTLPDSIYAMTSHGNNLYVACGTGGLRIFDITDPKSPVLVKTIGTATSIRNVSVTNGKGIYITDGVVNTPIGAEMKIFYVDQPK
ncbi:hypothetical protein GMLC_04800 [Geomonas limicola]|uniref:Lipoprotein n=1 Tax=Geomonas limicola TaxID=2740186 RepID=A0A6V8N389_9BACT|nr:hypothetical protein [Geomonas limicola]GFO66901.1 hypothetical protein GMLC_04800 [Geomonas limicola]